VVEPSSEHDEQGTDGWVPVREYTSLHEAGIAQGILESAGIESLLDNEATVGMLWHMSNAVGGLRVRVKRSELESARMLLSKEALDARLLLEDGTGASAPTREKDDDEPMETPVEAMVRRALVASLLGFFVPIVFHLWSLTLLLQVPFAKGRLAGRYRRRFVAALALTLLGLGGYVPFITMYAL
jgi:hypothetical protein